MIISSVQPKLTYFIFIVLASIHMFLCYSLISGNLVKTLSVRDEVIFEGFVSKITTVRGDSIVQVETNGKQYDSDNLKSNVVKKLVVGKYNKIITKVETKNVNSFVEYMIYFYICSMFAVYLLYAGHNTIFQKNSSVTCIFSSIVFIVIFLTLTIWFGVS